MSASLLPTPQVMARPSRSRLAAAALILLSADAHAQSINYGALEQLFAEPVTTSATGSPQRASAVPANMEIITQADIRRSGADNIPDVLQYVAGIDVRRYSLGQSEVSARGYDQPYSPRLLVLINGREVYMDDYGYTDWDSLPVQLDEIRQIEVVKGPNSALFGFNAVGGVIDIITYDPLFDSVNELTARAGTGDYGSASAVGTLQAPGRAGLRLSAGGWRGDEFSTADLPPIRGPYDTSPHQFSSSADGRLELTPTIELTGEGTVTDGRRIEATSAPALYTIGLRTNSGKLGLSADTSAGLIDVVGYRNDAFYSVDTDIGGFRMDDALDVLQANDLFRIGPAHTVRLGLEYHDEAASGIGPHEVGDRLYAASGMWNWQIAPEVALSNAVRVDRLLMSFRNSILPDRLDQADGGKGSFTTFSFNSGLVYAPSALDTVRLLAARGEQAPSLADVGLQQQYELGGESIAFAGNPDLRPATVMNYEIDNDRALSVVRSVLRVAVYYERTSNLLASAVNTPLAPTAAGLIAYSENVGRSAAAGGELELKGKNVAGWRWNASYARVDITQDLTIGALTGSSTLLDYAHGSPANVVDAGIGYGINRVDIDVEGRWQSQFTDYAPNQADVVVPFAIGSYLTVSARLAYRVNEHVTLALSGQQLTHARLLEAAGTPVERRVLATINAKL